MLYNDLKKHNILRMLKYELNEINNTIEILEIKLSDFGESK